MSGTWAAADVYKRRTVPGGGRMESEGKYETVEVFDEGLEKYIGLPDPKVWKFCFLRVDTLNV